MYTLISDLIMNLPEWRPPLGISEATLLQIFSERLHNTYTNILWVVNGYEVYCLQYLV